MDSKKYNNTKLAIGISKSIVVFVLIFLFVFLDYSLKLDNYLFQTFENPYLRFIIFILIIGFAGSILFSPLSYYSGFYLEHKYNLSNQNIWKWILENLKGLVVSLAVGIPVLLIFYYSLEKFNTDWWLPFSIAMFFISVVLARIAPIVILPLFYKIIPIENDELKFRISELSKDAGLKIDNVYKFDMSKNTRKANAAFTGIGKSKRIILGDTLLEKYSNDEIETVLAHEMGHYKKKHIVKGIFFNTALSFITFFVIAKLYEHSIALFGFNSLTQIGALPLLTLWAMVVGLFLTPLGNILSRKYEYEADEYAVTATSKADDFISTLNKLSEQNLGDKQPHPFVEWFFYSHPSIEKRIKAIKEFAGTNNYRNTELAGKS
ncbi:MAG: M48 family metallopeptidase [Ignavibacteriales bacterium]|nr:MAG: M48 family metallopeptidase [Ignavibacteriales bacterium]